jgi:hypothetical protein
MACAGKNERDGNFIISSFVLPDRIPDRFRGVKTIGSPDCRLMVLKRKKRS